jgi:hypothetical protein
MNPGGLFVSSSGIVGIGATDPVKTLDVRGTLAISNNASSYWYMDRDDSDGRFKILTDGNSEKFSISTAGTATFTNTETTFNYNPQSGSLLSGYNYLNFGGGSIMYRNTTDLYIGSNAKYGSAGTTVACYTSANGMGMLTMDGGALNYQSATGSVTANTAYGMPIRFTITSAGNIGMGTSSPTAKLTVVKSTRSSTLGASSVLQISDASAAGQAVGDRAEINFYTNSDSLPGNLQHATIGIIKTSTSGNETADLYFATSTLGGSPVERLRITSGGRVFIGVASDPAGGALAVASNGVVVQSGANYRQMYQSGNTMYWFNGSNEAYLSSAGVWTNASDIFIKKDINDIKYGLNEVMKLKPKSYKMIDDDLEQIGFIAQDIEEVLPELVSTSERGMKGLSYGNLTAVLTKAIQELKTQNDALQSRIETLESK